MAYFVTGGTGFIGRFLIEKLLRRGEPVYVLVRKGSQKKLATLRDTWGAGSERVIAVTGDLAKPQLGVSSAEIARLKGKVKHLFHLAAGRAPGGRTATPTGETYAAVRSDSERGWAARTRSSRSATSGLSPSASARSQASMHSLMRSVRASACA